MTEEEIEDHVDERTEYRNEYDANLERKNAELEKQAVIDTLTGLPNRKGFMDELEKALASMRQPSVPDKKQRSNEQSVPVLGEFALLFIDLDNFKRVNDDLGHDQGDVALQKTARVLERSIRKGEVAARLHGDEFAVFLPRTDEESATMVAEKILENLRGDSELQNFGIDASIGVRHIGKSDLMEGVIPATLMKDADLRQGEAKRAGKGTVVTHKK